MVDGHFNALVSFIGGLLLLCALARADAQPKPPLLCAASGDCAGAASPSREILFQRLFEGSEPMQGLELISRSLLPGGVPNYPTLSTAHARTGQKSLRFAYDWRNSLDQGVKGDRAEVRVVTTMPFSKDNSEVPYGNCEVYFGFSVYLPSPWQVGTEGGSILLQLQTFSANPASGTTADQPQFAISENSSGNFGMVYRYWNPSMPKRLEISSNLGPVVRDKWVDFQVRIKLSDSPTGGGLTVRKRIPSESSTFTQYYHQEGLHGTGFDNDGNYYTWGILYKFGQYKWIYVNGDYTPPLGEQTQWTHYQDNHVASACNEGNWEMVTPSGSGF